ncbi:hypothetical protein P154DRAFT_620353 [Amniculicola lignicola CBS 123094]|uniref:RRM domain-containing protein n=1 Tax=Amniculicola lignicola CBS 123094 TaxID=1392246 RepID=A0A6A5WGR0_9PLEO|nr:hypothetical protein P154DRAFT_620353 [Amniculicola lignicola CBS 123094]
MPAGVTTCNENYLLIASGPYQGAPFLAGWQEFKDSVRKHVSRQPGWTHVEQGLRRGESRGWCRLEKKEDAEAAYDHYVLTRSVLVHLFKTSRSNGDYRLLKCNCWPHFPDMSERSHSPNRSGLDLGVINQNIPKTYQPPMAQYITPTPSNYSYPVYPQVVGYSPPTYPAYPTATEYQATQMPIYSTSTRGLAVNISDGSVCTEARGIFLQGLHYSVTTSDLYTLVSTVVRPIHWKVNKDSKGSSTGTGTARFNNRAEADYAVHYLNQKEHKGRTITVRLDTDTTIVGQQGPVIVNGSTASTRIRAGYFPSFDNAPGVHCGLCALLHAHEISACAPSTRPDIQSDFSGFRVGLGAVTEAYSPSVLL